MKKTFAKIAIVSMASLGLAACGSTKVQYANPNEVNTTSVDFNQTDLQTVASGMVQSLLTFKPIVELTAQHRPVVFVDQLRNMTDEHIDMGAIDDTVSTKLIQSGKFRFVDMKAVNAVKTQLNYQKDSGLVDPSSAVNIGHQIGAQFMLYGTLTNMVQRSSKVTDVYYLMTMKLMNLETGIIEWQGQKQIRKVQTKSTFGF